MTNSTRIVRGIAAAALSLSLALAPAAFAQDAMKQDLDFRNGLSGDDGVRKGTTSKYPMKKDEGMKKYGLSK